MKAATRVRLGIAGCGAMGAVHLRNARKLRGVEVVALADPDELALVRAARLAPDAALYRSVDALLAGPPVDAIVVSTPSGAHAADALAVLAAGRHLYLEKPIATNAADGAKVALAARSAGVAAVGFNRRLHPLVLVARQLVEAGALQEVTAARSLFAEPIADRLPEWKRWRETGGGAPLDLASHHVDLLRFLLRTEPVAVGGELRSVRSEHDDCTLGFRFGDCDAELHCSFVRPREDRLELVGRNGHRVSIDRYRGVVAVGCRPVRAPRLAVLRGWARLGRARDSYRQALAAFVHATRGAAVPVPTIDDGLASLEAVLAAEELALR